MSDGIAGEKIYRAVSTMALVNSATETPCRILAIELAPLQVNIVSPGFVGPKSETVRELAAQFPMQTLATLDEIASAYISLMANLTSQALSRLLMVVRGWVEIIWPNKALQPTGKPLARFAGGGVRARFRRT